MAVVLAGGCRVTSLREGEPVVTGTLRSWPQVGRAVGAQAISLRVLEFAPGLSPGLRNESCDEISYVLAGSAMLYIDGQVYLVSAETGVYLRPGETLTIDNPGPGPFVLVSAQCPEPQTTAEIVPAVTSPLADATPTVPPPVVRLAQRKAMPTADRWYRVLIDDEVGSRQATQFVGSIPPGRAPDHFHHYEEVLVILRGHGRMWTGETSAEIGPGSCVYLPKGQTHCVENTGRAELRLLGVFYPAGSPAVRYAT
jgi:mannose-6-phosphate isomerase-like protein (cupin superfamily)